MDEKRVRVGAFFVLSTASPNSRDATADSKSNGDEVAQAAVVFRGLLYSINRAESLRKKWMIRPIV